MQQFSFPTGTGGQPYIVSCPPYMCSELFMQYVDNE